MSNLPLNRGLTSQDLSEIVTTFLMENYLTDPGNHYPIKEVAVDPVRNSAVIELSSVEEANRLLKVGSVKVFGNSCRIARVGESRFGETVTQQSLVQNA